VFPDSPLNRRGFLRMTGGLLALSRLRALPALAESAPTTGGALRVLSQRDARILSAIAERMTFTGDPDMPRFGETAALPTIDGALLQLPPDVAQQLSIALLLFEYAPPLFLGRASTFTGLAPQWQDLYLDAWAGSRFATCRLAFQAFKNLSMLGYYSQDSTWPAIHYSGPWAPRPRRVIADG